ncbi:MAG: NAD-dependent succinate-semialdehyde dehydrogenase [Sphingomonas sp.]|nr:NAD-dependent succinate-semialdehyde dehydrogenase [Sphingomonas sp.]
MDQSQRNAVIQYKPLLRASAYIDGAWMDASDGKAIDVTDPFTGGLISTIPSLSQAQVQAAINAAERAFPAWSRQPARERGKVLRRLLDLILRHRDDLARLITLENGKPLKEAYGEVDYGAGFVEVYAEEATRALGEIIPAPVPGRKLYAEKEALGVCAAITPWNFPLAMLTRKFAPALAAGCTMVAKPASQTPLAALALAQLAEEAGVPPGVFSVVTGRASMIGDLFTRSPVVRKISFTGSTEIGVQLMAASAPTVKRLSMELGGNAPMLIFDDADLGTAVDAAMVAKFRNCGQSCIAANRIYVQKGIHDAFTKTFAQRVAAMKLGDGLEADTDIGPLIDEAAVAKVNEHLGEALAGGGQVLAGGRGEGRMAPPTLVTGVRADALLTREETFGPLAGIIAFERYDEAIRLANDTPFGLASYVCATNVETIHKASRDIESGMVGVNTGLISTPYAPFGGVKLSGIGKEGSAHGLDEYLNLKYVCHAGL